MSCIFDLLDKRLFLCILFLMSKLLLCCFFVMQPNEMCVRAAVFVCLNLVGKKLNFRIK